MGQAGAAQAPRREELVVGGEERGRRVQHLNARVQEPLEWPESLLDPVEVLANIEARKRYVTVFEGQQRLTWREKLDRFAVPAARREGEIRVAWPVGNDRYTHRHPTVVLPSFRVGCEAVTNSLESRA
jgi:hypothetical protein